MSRFFAIKSAVTSLLGFSGGFFFTHAFLEYDHEAGLVFPVGIGIWTTLLVVGLVLRGKTL